jgi:5-methylcytosine-specific restriction endonuclease McrA
LPLLSPLIDQDEEVFAAIGDAKRGPRRERLRTIRPVVQSRYEEYRNLLPRLQNLTCCPLSSRLRRDCLHCYDSPTEPLGRLISSVLGIRPANGSPLCQYCLIGEIDCLDHYVPRKVFPEFSILPRNLVPACSKCNRLKGTAWIAGKSRKILNLYYDDIPSARFLRVNVTFLRQDRATIEFSLNQPRSINDAHFERIKRHFNKLALIERYNVRSAEEVSELLGIAQKTAAQGRDVIAANLAAMANIHVRRHGANYWKAVLTRHLANNEEFFATVGVS